MSDATPAVVYRRTGPVAEIRFNRPARLNVLDRDVARGFEASVERALGDAETRVIVVSAEGRAFVAGGDLAHFYRARNKAAAAEELIGPMHGALHKLADAPIVTVGSLRGPVAGGGMSLALCLDLLVAAEGTTFNMAYARIGASPDCGGSWSLPRLVGFRRALEIALLCETLDAEAALSLGLVNRVVPPAALEAETAEIAARLASVPPAAVAHTKALMRRSPERTLSEQLEAEAAAFADCAGTERFGAAVAAFIEKRSRPPRDDQGASETRS